MTPLERWKRFEATWFAQRIFLPVLWVITRPLVPVVVLIIMVGELFKKDGGV